MSDEQLQKKGMSGCMIAFLVIGGVGLLCVMAAGVGLYVFSQSDTGKQIVGAFGDMKDMVEKGSTAPGTEEARAAGCVSAMVIDGANLAQFGAKFGDSSKLENVPDGLMVMCSVGMSSTLTCEQLAKVYSGAAGIPNKKTTVVIQKQGSQGPSCEKQLELGAAAQPRPTGH